jgi:hypothetical protein
MIIAACFAFVAGCYSTSTIAPPTRSLITGDTDLRKKAKTIAVVAFMVDFIDVYPDDNPVKVFSPESDVQKMVERHYKAFREALNRSTQFKLVPHETVAKNGYYQSMAVEHAIEEQRFYNKTVPVGLRKMTAEDAFDYEFLCRELKADALLFFNCAYHWDSDESHKEGAIVNCMCRVVDAEGRILYLQEMFNQSSGMRGGISIASGLDSEKETKIWLIEEATRIFAEDFICVFENRPNPALGQ